MDWLSHHPAGTTVVPSLARPLDASVTIMKQSSLPFGFELVATVVKVLSGRESYEVLGATAAVGIPAAVSGRARLAEVIAARRALLLGAAAVAVTSPMLVLTFAENYLTHFLGLALMPFALAAAARYFSEPSVGRLVTAALASAGVVGVYVGLLPWLVFLVVAASLVVPGGMPAWAERLVRRRRGRGARAVARLAPLALVTLVVSPLAAYRAWEFSTLASGFSGGGGFTAYPAKVNVSLLLGALPLPTKPIGAATVLGAVAVLLALGLALTIGRVRLNLVPAVLVAAVLAATGLVYLNYDRSGYNYGTFKTMVSGGALLAGLVVVALLARASAAGRPPSPSRRSASAPWSGCRTPPRSSGTSAGRGPASGRTIAHWVRLSEPCRRGRACSWTVRTRAAAPTCSSSE